MKTPRLLPVLFALAALAAPARSQTAETPSAPETAGTPVTTTAPETPVNSTTSAPPVTPPALHLGSFSSVRAARLAADGTLDTGAGFFRLIDLDTGRQLAPAALQYVKGPEFVSEWTQKVGEVTVTVRMLATGSVRNADDRTKAVMHVTLANHTDAAQTVNLGLSVLPGGGDPALRPAPSLPFAPGSRFALEDKLLTRDGAVLLTWVGLDPVDVNILPPPATAESPAAMLTWALPLEPRTARYLDLFVAGPNASGSVDESAWRDAITRWSYVKLEEQLIWQSRFRGYYADIELGDQALRRALIGAVHMLRLCGDADRDFRAFSDRPYGHPATDDAVQAEALGVMAEWSFGENSADMVRLFVAEAVARGQGLSPERRVALAHGLARAVRVNADMELVQQLAVAIRALVTQPAAVLPWHDPAVVAQDLQGILDRGGPAADGADHALPALSWAAEPATPVLATMLAMRRALSADDGPAAWTALKSLLAHTTVNGLGSTRADGELDPLFGMGLMALVRTMFIEDHGDDLHLFPHLPSDLVPFPGALDLTTLATHFGLASAQTHFVGAGRRTLGAQLRVHGNKAFGRILVHVPYDCRAVETRGPVGGSVELLPDGTVECVQDPFNNKGLRFNIKLAAP